MGFRELLKPDDEVANFGFAGLKAYMRRIGLDPPKFANKTDLVERCIARREELQDAVQATQVRGQATTPSVEDKASPAGPSLYMSLISDKKTPDPPPRPPPP